MKFVFVMWPNGNLRVLSHFAVIMPIDTVEVRTCFASSNSILSQFFRHRYSQYLTAQVVDSNGSPVNKTRSSFYHLLCSLEWVPAYRPLEEEKQERKYLCPSSVYLTSPEVCRLLGTHVFYVDTSSSEFSRALGRNASTRTSTSVL